MNNTAWITAKAHEGIVSGGEPMVFIDGQPQPSLRVGQMVRRGPLDEVEVELEYTPQTARVIEARSWEAKHCMVVKVCRLDGGELRWMVLAEGRLQELNSDDQPGRRRHRFVLEDDWNAVLREPLKSVWGWVDGQVQSIPAGGLWLEVGERSNRSLLQCALGGLVGWAVRATAQGEAWTLGQTLQAISTWGRLHLSERSLPEEVAGLPLSVRVDLSLPLAEVLEHVLEAHGLMMERQRWKEGAQASEQRRVMLKAEGRQVAEPAPMNETQRMSVVRQRMTESPATAREWIVQADGWVLESTFELHSGWAPPLAGQPPETYSPATNAQFAQVANVYRLWVLNEDGAFSSPATGSAPRFDLATFFDDPSVPIKPVRFLDGLVMEAGGVRRKPRVEQSVDGGNTWQPWAGRVSILNDRAGLRLDDATLSAEVFTAAASGQWRMRVTASLRSPNPVTLRRWQGNPFGRVEEARVLSVGSMFAFRRVTPGSLHDAAIRNGTLWADERNDEPAMWDWLLGQMALGENDGNHDEQRVTLAGAQTMWRPGDRWRELADGRGWRVTQVNCRWPGGEVGMNSGTQATRTFGPTTELVCVRMKGG